MISKALKLEKETIRSMRLQTGLKAGPIVKGSDSGSVPAPSSIIVQDCVSPMEPGATPLAGMEGN